MTADDKVSARFILDLAQHLTAHCRVTVLAPAGPQTSAWETWGDVRVRRFSYFVPAAQQRLAAGEGMVATMRASWFAKLQAPFFVASQWAMLPELVRDAQVDLVNPHWILPQGLSAAAWRQRLGLPMVVTAHGADVALLGRMPAGRTIGRYIFARSEGFIADSEFLAQRTEEIVGHPIPHSAIPMGVATTVFAGSNRQELAREQATTTPTILFVGKFVLKKGIPVLLDALAGLRADGRSVRLRLIGGGPLEGELRDAVQQRNLTELVEFVGWVKNDELPRYYAAADVVCIPSVQDAHGETEGTPVVLQEALACGALVVASQSSGIADVLRDGVNGWVAEPGNSADLKSKLRSALDAAPSVRQAVREAARHTASESAWPRVAERFYDVFTDAMQRATLRTKR